MAIISRSEFIIKYKSIFDKLFTIDSFGKCIFKHKADWDGIEFPGMTLSGWSTDTVTFQHSLAFISKVVKPTYFVLTEVESMKKFTEVQFVQANQGCVEKLWITSHLPHFDTICFDETSTWCARFNNLLDHTYFYRRPT